MKSKITKAIFVSLLGLITTCTPSRDIKPEDSPKIKNLEELGELAELSEDVDAYTEFEEVSIYSTYKAERGPKPSWYISPKTEYQRCAVNICNKFPMLCYKDCLIISKRLKDYLPDASKSCNYLPDSLPFEGDVSDVPCQ